MSHLPYPVKLIPIVQQRIWGGHKLKPMFGISEIEEPIGEYWILSGHPHGTSIVQNGWLAGKSLVEIIDLYPKAYLGQSPQSRFPLLVKFLEAEADLSVQIHPNDLYAQALEGDYGKTEAWYIFDCKVNGRVNHGHQFTSREEFLHAVDAHQIENYLTYREIEKDRVVYVPARTLHAILAGTIIIEIQQTSDITYRVYDWDRVDKNGKPRELHIQRAADVLQYAAPLTMDESTVAEIISCTETLKHERLIKCPYFTLERLVFQTDFAPTLRRGSAISPDIVILVDGCAMLKWEEEMIELCAGDAVLIPTTIDEYGFVPKGNTKILRVFY